MGYRLLNGNPARPRRAVAISPRRAAVVCWLFALLLALSPAHAEDGLDNLVSTVGTTIQDGTGRSWAYLLWLESSPNLLNGRTIAIYSKPGPASAATPFTRLAIVQLQTDPRNIEPLLRRSQNLGQDLNQLEADLHELFQALMPTNVLSRADQLAAVIRGSLLDERHRRNLTLLSRRHPAVSLAIGAAYADVILPGETTFEVRPFDPGSQLDAGVIGRVTVTAGVPPVLPAPGPAVVVLDPSPKGNLNVPLRWGTPDALRRLALLSYGFNVWRVARPYAEAPGRNWHLSPPTNSALWNAALANPQSVRRCNFLPVLNDEELSPAEAQNSLLASNIVFYVDDDGRFRPGYTTGGFTNGAQFYYFIAARDILGRDGMVSPGTLALVCDRQPPAPPEEVKVENDYRYAGGVGTQRLRVTWQQNTNQLDPITNYWVYRWTNIDEIHLKAGNPSNNLIAVIRHTNGLPTTTWLDGGPGAPSTNADLGRTFWYTVRAADLGACGPNLSPNSAPVFGVLRDRDGPPPPGGAVRPWCPALTVAYLGTQSGPAIPNPTGYNLRLVATRNSSQVAWVGFVVVVYGASGGPTRTNNTGIAWFPPGAGPVAFEMIVPFSLEPIAVMVYPLAASFNGAFSPFPTEVYSVALNTLNRSARNDLNFEARIVRGTGKLFDNCNQHWPIAPDGTKTPIDLTVIPSLGSKEWRLYRRIDQGPLTLISQGPVTNGTSSFTAPDGSLPVSGGEICYFLQTLDEHGNASALTQLGCVQSTPTTQPPAPMLAPPIASGVTNNAGMILKWFCPAPGVERFHVYVAAKPNAPHTNPAPGILSFDGFAPGLSVVKQGKTNVLDFFVYNTSKIGAGLQGGPEFAVPYSIAIGNNYTVFVKAVGKGGLISDPSNCEKFLWSPTNAPAPQVPWPARGLPPITASDAFPSVTPGLSALSAAYLSEPYLRFTGAVVVIGTHTNNFPLGGEGPAGSASRPQYYPFFANPLQFVATNKSGQSLFPCALYRYQVANAGFPIVSGDILQVSPLMEKIAHQFVTVTNATGFVSSRTIIHDPYLLFGVLQITDNFDLINCSLIDTQPVIHGARYRYLVVRFNDQREVEEVIATNEVDIP